MVDLAYPVRALGGQISNLHQYLKNIESYHFGKLYTIAYDDYVDYYLVQGPAKRVFNWIADNPIKTGLIGAGIIGAFILYKAHPLGPKVKENPDDPDAIPPPGEEEGKEINGADDEEIHSDPEGGVEDGREISGLGSGEAAQGSEHRERRLKGAEDKDKIDEAERLAGSGSDKEIGSDAAEVDEENGGAGSTPSSSATSTDAKTVARDSTRLASLAAKATVAAAPKLATPAKKADDVSELKPAPLAAKAAASAKKDTAKKNRTRNATPPAANNDLDATKLRDLLSAPTPLAATVLPAATLAAKAAAAPAASVNGKPPAATSDDEAGKPKPTTPAAKAAASTDAKKPDVVAGDPPPAAPIAPESAAVLESLLNGAGAPDAGIKTT